MEGDHRRLQPASIGFFSIETGTERFMSNGHLDPLPFSAWRNNVTALSQRYNLYLVAAGDHIAVFAPEFPYQKLRRVPSLIITPTLSNRDARGYIDEALPHAVNHLVVGDLGSEEILLVARDSGNIDAYYTRAIRDAIETDSSRPSVGRFSHYVGLRPFFSQWVHESAWGLAIHKEARMIAVSANTPFHIESEDQCAKITVFAFALAKAQDSGDIDNHDDQDSNSSLSEWRTWIPSATKPDNETGPLRDHNYKIILGKGHTNNIPSICFANSIEDRFGTWLFSTDIDGTMIAWKIWQKRIVNSWTTVASGASTFRLNRVFGRYSEILRDVARRVDGGTDRGWLVATLDLKAFAVTSNITEFCGSSPSQKSSCFDPVSTQSFGVTDVAGFYVPGNSQRHPLHRQLDLDANSDSSDDPAETARGEDSHVHSDEDSNEDSDEDSDEESNEDSDEGSDLLESDEVDYSDDVVPLEQAMSAVVTNRTEEARIRAVSDQMSDSWPVVGSEAREVMEDEEASGSNEQNRDHDRFSHTTSSSTSLSSVNLPILDDDGIVGRLRTAQEDEEDLSVYGAGSMAATSAKVPSSEESRPNMEHSPTFPLLHCSVSHMRLFEAPFAARAHWYCADLLTQIVPNQFAQTAQYGLDRLNMIQQIPELGLVILASQSGRCAVCSTMRKGKDGPLGLRVDWVLPTKKQEKAGLRPPHALLGIAVGPIQGMFHGEDNEQVYDSAFQDGTIQGTPTSFDREVVLMDSSEDESRGSDQEHDAKRLKTLPLPSTAIKAHPRKEERGWSQAGTVEAWRGINYSRRYRLMLTYYDWTVLTYEIAREAPNLGVDPKRNNYRNRSSADTGYYNFSMDRSV